MTKNKALKDLVEVRSVAVSNNGYPIYDIFQKVYPDNGYGDKLDGYVGTTGIMFYTEEPSLLDELGEIFDEDKIELYQEFFTKNIDKLYTTSELREINITELNHEESFSYGHLCNKESAKRTLSQKHYGCIHLDTGLEMLIFHQSKLYNYIKLDKMDLTNPNEYQSLRSLLVDLYQAKKITPEATLIGKPYENIKVALNSVLNNINVEGLTKYQQDITQLLMDFKNEMNIKLTIDFSNQTNGYVATIKNETINFSFEIPQEKKSEFHLNHNGERLNKTHTTIAEVLDTVYSTITNKAINNFISKIKI